MRTLIPILFTILLITSCKKEVCYYCETSTFSKYDGRLVKYDSEMICDKSESEITQYELSQYDFKDPITYTSCECKKQ
jgi:hypothetical protein